MATTPRIRHLRHRLFDRVRHSRRLKAWLAFQAERLMISTYDVFEMLRNSSAQAVERAEPAGTAPTNTSPPYISGASSIGNMKTGNPGVWDGEPVLTYRWLLDGEAIEGQTGTSIVSETFVEGDVGKELVFEVTGTNDHGTLVVESEPMTLTS